jgi:tRNA (Thr-GGU) A37 N-methylase
VILQAQLEIIGQIFTPYQSLAECPPNIDPDGPPCSIVVRQELREGLMGLEIGQKILILYWFERANRSVLRQ